MDDTHSTPSYRLLGIFGVFFGTLTAICLPFISPATRKYCIPYIPATNKQVNNLLKICKQINSQHSNADGIKVCDLGSGDGRIILELAKCGIHGYGYELNPWLVIWSKFGAYYGGVKKVAQFRRKNLWDVKLSRYDVIIVFGVAEMIPELELKLNSELREGVSVISGRFPLKRNTNEILGDGAEKIWIYRY
ncbi:hypothetical protein LOD99_9961 [Oopsacas minuta]|uniref:Uncharacterized protein n=1 Tax=Oopsacas minuta TaxID=111878 RepID=A0AAV7KK32_9METZ|nr:hypothetical protein LOD99_9961 [Oopsacas minuta]